MDDIKNRNIESDGREDNYSDFTRAVEEINEADSGDDSGMNEDMLSQEFGESFEKDVKAMDAINKQSNGL